jgi:hypothetical protein
MQGFFVFVWLFLFLFRVDAGSCEEDVVAVLLSTHDMRSHVFRREDAREPSQDKKDGATPRASMPKW